MDASKDDMKGLIDLPNNESIVEDEAEDSDSKDENPVRNIPYTVSTRGMDIDVVGLVNRLKKEEIFIPSFQRNYVWTPKKASKFIESLVIGLPVPGIFLSERRDDGKLYIIDGLQRLLTLKFYYNGFFESHDSNDKKSFQLVGIGKDLNGKKYTELSDKAKRTLDNATIHAFVVRQNLPENDGDSSVYEIFHRLNSGGQNLEPQEIRCAAYYGEFVDFLKKLNENNYWRQIFGKKDLHGKDHELILRFFALYFGWQDYSISMTEFLNDYFSKHQKLSTDEKAQWEKLFETTIKTIYESFGDKAFRKSDNHRAKLIAAICDAVMVGVAKRITDSIKPIDVNKVKEIYPNLLKNPEFFEAATSRTSHPINVKKRIELSIKSFKMA